MAVNLGGGINGQRPVVTFPCGSAPNSPEKGEVFVADRFKLVTAALAPRSVCERLGEANDVTRPPAETSAESQHNQTEPSSLTLSDAR
jgi:hypothetical protein